MLPGAASALAFATDGTELLVLGWDGTGRVVETDGMTETGHFPTHATGYGHALVTTDDRQMFVASGESAAVWDPATRRRLVPSLSVSGDGTNNALFLSEDPAAHRLVIGTQHSVTLVTLDPLARADAACRTAGRPLTEDEWNRLVPDHSYEPACAGRPEAHRPVRWSGPGAAFRRRTAP